MRVLHAWRLRQPLAEPMVPAFRRASALLFIIKTLFDLPAAEADAWTTLSTGQALATCKTAAPTPVPISAFWLCCQGFPMPMPGYSHYFLSRHMAEHEGRKRRAHPTQPEKLTLRAEKAEQKGMLSGAAMAVVFVCLGLAALAVIGLGSP